MGKNNTLGNGIELGVIGLCGLACIMAIKGENWLALILLASAIVINIITNKLK